MTHKWIKEIFGLEGREWKKGRKKKKRIWSKIKDEWMTKGSNKEKIWWRDSVLERERN